MYFKLDNIATSHLHMNFIGWNITGDVEKMSFINLS